MVCWIEREKSPFLPYLMVGILLAIYESTSTTRVTVKQQGQTIAGGTAHLGCDYIPVLESASYFSGVYWYGDNKRLISGNSSGLTSTNKPDKYRLNFDFTTSATLIIQNIDLNDAMDYKCHLIADISGTGLSPELHLNVLVPPPWTLIRDPTSHENFTDGSEIFLEAGQVCTIQCISGPSNPPASITWIEHGLSLVHQEQVEEPYAVDIRLTESSRSISFTPSLEDNGRVLSCRATHITRQSYITTTVRLIVIVPPRTVSIIDEDTGNAITSETTSVDDGVALTYKCFVPSTKPAATLTWFLDGNEIPGTTRTNSSSVDPELVDNFSQIKIKVSSKLLHNKELGCSAHISEGSSSSVMATVSFKVYGPPTEMQIFGAEELMEGTRYEISCTARDGYPQPTIVWLIGGNDITVRAYEKRMDVRLNGRFDIISNITGAFTRLDHGKIIVCHAIHTAVSNGITSTISSNATLNVRYCPTNISATCPALQNGEYGSVTCTDVFSNPWVGITLTQNGSLIVDADVNTTTFDIDQPVKGTFTDLRYGRQYYREDGVSLFTCCTMHTSYCVDRCETCRTEFLYAPENVDIQLWKDNVETSHVTEGDDNITMTCCADANPAPAGLLTWHHEGVQDLNDPGMNSLLEPSFTSSSSPSPNRYCSSLIFSPVAVGRAGGYTCRANNGIAGDTYISRDLVVNFAPYVTVQNHVILVNEQSSAKLECGVKALPRPEVHWFFAGGRIDIADSRYRDLSTITMDEDTFLSRITYRLVIDNVLPADAGNYTCTASNAIGSNKQTIRLVVATEPDAPQNLTAPLNLTTETSVVVRWTPGYDGGRRQTFSLVYCLKNLPQSCLQAPAIHNTTYAFDPETLKPFTVYNIAVWSRNEVGESERTSIIVSTRPVKVSDLGLEITYSASQGIVGVQSTGGSMEGDLPIDLCLTLEISRGEGWMRQDGCIMKGTVRKVPRGLVGAQLRVLSCGRGMCSAPSAVKTQEGSSRDTLYLIIGGNVGFILLIIIIIIIVTLTRFKCRKKENAAINLEHKREDRPSHTSLDNGYQPLSFRTPLPSQPPPKGSELSSCYNDIGDNECPYSVVKDEYSCAKVFDAPINHVYFACEISSQTDVDGEGGPSKLDNEDYEVPMVPITSPTSSKRLPRGAREDQTSNLDEQHLYMNFSGPPFP